MTVVGISRELLHKTSEKLHPVKLLGQLGEVALEALNQTQAVPKVAKLDFNGNHALIPGREQRTVLELGASAFKVPFLRHTPRHSIDDPHLNSVWKTQEFIHRRGHLDDDFLFTHDPSLTQQGFGIPGHATSKKR